MDAAYDFKLEVIGNVRNSFLSRNAVLQRRLFIYV
jgi:hypothetical protein